MRALITGATGLVGSHLAQRLIRDGHDVIALARKTSNLRWIQDLNCEIRYADVNDFESLQHAIQDVDTVFHVAGLTRARDQETYMRVNAEGTRKLLDAIVRSKAAVKRFIYISSLAAHGPAQSETPPDEQSDPHPLPGYGASKLQAERIVAEYSDQIETVVVRPPAVYGPRDENFLPLFRSAQKSGLVPMLGSAHNKVSLVHVEDLADGIYRAGTSEKSPGNTYFISGEVRTLKQLAGALRIALKRRIITVPVPALIARIIGEIGELKWTLTGKDQIVSRRKINDALQPRWICSDAKARLDLGYAPKHAFEEGFTETAQWYADNGWIRQLPEES